MTLWTGLTILNQYNKWVDIGKSVENMKKLPTVVVTPSRFKLQVNPIDKGEIVTLQVPGQV